MVVKSFLVTGISNKLDRSEDDEFQGYNKIQDIFKVKNDFNKSDKEEENKKIDVEDSIDSSENGSDLEIENEKI